MHPTFSDLLRRPAALDARTKAADARYDYASAVNEYNAFPAFEEPYIVRDIRELEAIAADIVSLSHRVASHLTALHFGCKPGPVDVQELALRIAEGLDPELTSEQAGVIYADIKEAFAVASERRAA